MLSDQKKIAEEKKKDKQEQKPHLFMCVCQHTAAQWPAAAARRINRKSHLSAQAAG